MARRKIVIISTDSGGGGIWAFNRHSLDSMSREADVSIVLADPFADPEQDSADSFRALPGLPRTSKLIATARRAWIKACALEPDIVELGDWPLGFVPAVLDQSIPYVVQCHGSMGQIAEHDPQKDQVFENGIVQLIEPQLLASAHRVQSLSEMNAAFWTRTANRPVKMIRPAFALPELTRYTDGISDRAAVFGRLQRWKGPHILCEALRQLGAAGPAVDWYGSVKPWDHSDEPTDRFLAWAFPDVWSNRFCHHPAVPHSTVTEIQALSLFNIVPSTWDVFNFTAVEAMAAARPLIVSKGAGASELVIDGENGFTFENGNSESLATAIDRVLSLPEKRRVEIGQAGRETVRVELDPVLIAEQRMAAYGEAIQSFVTSPPSIPNSWLADFIDPSSDRKVDVGDLLEGLPITSIARHMKDRVLRKFR